MNGQEVFNQVYIHLLTQNERATQTDSSGETKCKYLTPEGLKCAVGCLITPEEYSISFEKKLVSGLVMYELLSPRLKEIFSNNISLLQSLQGIHDCSEPHMWKEKLANVAENRGFTIPEMP